MRQQYHSEVRKVKSNPQIWRARVSIVFQGKRLLAIRDASDGLTALANAKAVLVSKEPQLKEVFKELPTITDF